MRRLNTQLIQTYFIEKNQHTFNKETFTRKKKPYSIMRKFNSARGLSFNSFGVT